MAPPKKGDLADEEKELINAITAGQHDCVTVINNFFPRERLDYYTKPQGLDKEAKLPPKLAGPLHKIIMMTNLHPVKHGMTPLMHAAYKGKEDMCKLLLQHGADVNCNEQEHGYTALMFAGFSGNKNITYMMLEAGAETNVVNSVGRTAAQMAAFVGQHDCVTVINNFFPRERLDYYTKPQGLDKEAKLPPKLAGPLHKIIMMTNLHPVKIVMMVRENILLADAAALGKCYRVLDLICEKCFKQRDMNEVLAMKMHYISFILQKCITFLKDREDKLDGLIKSLLKGRDTDGFPSYQEKFIRECIKKFPYCDATLLQQLVRSIAPVEIGNDPTALSVLTQAITGQVGFIDAEFCTACGEKGADKRCSVCKMGNDPTALSVLTQAITGQVGFIDAEFCTACGEKGADKRCSVCKMVIYCAQDCQKQHWFTHNSCESEETIEDTSISQEEPSDGHNVEEKTQSGEPIALSVSESGISTAASETKQTSVSDVVLTGLA
ncbi:Ankyrin repeat and MYND domain-containing protein 2 [Acipenser ruthenus]|uniref:Ankyrin repeat and MYND domain-containing protein 2 n=1 Tax=Acipenser ruthenus TaxID=7906 RepID=A0A444UPY4_ACIRT|nr:Ankyrin repeat and MYND domain-containing protein 2 [Acipenser ruthenus]